MRSLLHSPVYPYLEDENPARADRWPGSSPFMRKHEYDHELRGSFKLVSVLCTHERQRSLKWNGD